MKWKMSAKKKVGTKKNTIAMLYLPAGVGSASPLYYSPKVTSLKFRQPHLMLFICAWLRITTFPAVFEGSIITEAVQPCPPITPPPTPLRVLLGGLLEGWLCFLCAARPRYHITAHMLMQQLPQPASPSTTPPPTHPHNPSTVPALFLTEPTYNGVKQIAISI